ncbi:uncharacterized protein LAESUDRAFT_812482 [Laetiporus sulphureus 93-53]|uniref:Uncharacterized protein n=1 Tax=Laetiporus sulphureus 93-53 TaxID=1314785 RepID=A0A165EDE3_9APHY|nr:uncharacterized protein LAESUDRAFT_812482 [Laetiporus sulphureus 93-53]KZT06794.1 hypothetical protein LAESUDRAFT_812482 [Laetiporus sulphureus 93-53]
MRSPVVAFSLIAAAAVSSASAANFPKSPDLSTGSLSPPADFLENRPGVISNYVHGKRRDIPAGLGTVNAAVHDPPRPNRDLVAHERRAPGERRVGSDRADARQDDGHAPPPRPEHPRPADGATGCNTGNTNAANVAGVEQNSPLAVVTGNPDGGVSCTGNVHGEPADQTGQLGSGESVVSPDAAPEEGSDVFNTNISDLLGQNDTSSSDNAIDSNAGETNDIAQPAFNANGYPIYPGTRTTQARRGLSTLTPTDARSSLYEVVNSTSQIAIRDEHHHHQALIRRLKMSGARVPRSGADVDSAYENDPVLDHVTAEGKPGESTQGAAIPGIGTPQHPGGNAYPGAVGSSRGGRVIESGNVINGEGASNVPGAGGRSQSGTAVGGNGVL